MVSWKLWYDIKGSDNSAFVTRRRSEDTNKGIFTAILSSTSRLPLRRVLNSLL